MLCKDRIIKFICILSLTLSVIFAQTVTASGVSIDGLHNGVEWDGATADQLFSGESNSKVNYALVKTMIEPEESAVYFCFMFIDPSLEPDNTSVGVMLTLNDFDSFTVSAESSPSAYDTSECVFDGALTIDENNGATCEIRVGFKQGLPERISATVRFIDSDGAMSNNYSFTVINSYYSETTELIITEEEPDTAAPETTKEKTAKQKTTRKKTTTEKEEKTTDYTLKPRTTKEEKKKTEFYIQTSPPYSYVRKTKAPKTTKAAITVTSAKPKTTKQKPATVYYYEKEIIISQVYVTAGETFFSDNLTTVSENADVTESTSAANITEKTSSAESDNKISLTDGTKYKIIIGAVAAASFTALAFASSRSSIKKSDNNNEPDSQ